MTQCITMRISPQHHIERHWRSRESWGGEGLRQFKQEIEVDGFCMTPGPYTGSCHSCVIWSLKVGRVESDIQNFAPAALNCHYEENSNWNETLFLDLAENWNILLKAKTISYIFYYYEFQKFWQMTALEVLFSDAAVADPFPNSNMTRVHEFYVDLARGGYCLDLGLTLKTARWVPRVLTAKHKSERIRCYKQIVKAEFCHGKR